MEKKNVWLIVLVVILIVAVLSLGGFIVYDKVINNSDEIKAEENNSSESLNNIDVSKLNYNGEDISDAIVENIKIDGYNSYDLNVKYDYNVKLTLSGEVVIYTDCSDGNYYNNKLIGINNIIDIIEFNEYGMPVGDERLIYMLTANGDVYYYKVGDSRNQKYNVTKVNNIPKVKKLFEYVKRTEMEGTPTIVAITLSDKCIELTK